MKRLGFLMLTVLAMTGPCFAAGPRSLNTEASPGSPFPKVDARILFVKYGGSLHHVVGAKRNNPVILMDDGSREMVTSSRFAHINMRVPAVGQVLIQDYVRQGDDLGEVNVITFQVDQDFEDLYIVFYIFHEGETEPELIWISEAGSVAANRETTMKFVRGSSTRLRGSGRIEFDFYHEGMPLIKRRRW